MRNYPIVNNNVETRKVQIVFEIEKVPKLSLR